MRCPSPQTLAQFHAGGLSPEEREIVRAHVASCESCKRRLAAADEPTEGAVQGRATTNERPARPSAPPPSNKRLGPGSLVGRYVIVSELGKGGMGAVFAAYDPNLARRVAIKLLHSGQSLGMPGAEAAARLQREAQALARVSHPNTVQVFDVDTHDGRVFIAMEHLEGETLREWLRTERPWREIVRVMREAGAGLASVHAVGLVHRDFKPTNVIVTRDGQVKVLDFGLARLSGDGQPAPRALVLPEELEEISNSSSLDTPLTSEGSLSGTPGYVSLELLDGKAATPASDQFAFGVTLFQALYGKRPFEARTFAQMARALNAGLPVAPPTKPGVPGWLYPIVRRSLANDPAARYPSMSQLLDALGDDPSVKRRRWAVRGVVVALLLGGVLVGSRLSRAECPSEPELLAQVWSGATRQTLEERLVSSRPESAARVMAALSLLESRAASWAHDSAQACVASSRRRATHEDLQRSLCLTRRGRALEILASSLKEADPSVVARSDELVDAFLHDASCADAAQLSRLTPDDVAPAQEALAQELRATLFRARALSLLQIGDRAIAASRDVQARAADAGLAGFEAEALSLSGSLEYSQGDEAASLRDFGLSLERAVSAGVDDRAFYSAVVLVKRLAGKEGRMDEAKRVLSIAHGLLQRLGKSPELELEVLEAEQLVLGYEGRKAEAAKVCEQRVTLAKQAFGPRSREAAEAMIVLAAAVWELGQVHQSNALEEEAFALLKAFKGPDDPSMTPRFQTLGLGWLEEGRKADARALLEEGLAHAKKARPNGDAQTADLMVQLSEALQGVDEARALELSGAAVKFYEAGTDSESLAYAVDSHARALNASGRSKEALAECVRAQTLLAGQVDPGGSTIRDFLVTQGEVLLSLKDAKGALDVWSRAYATAPSYLPSTRGQVAFGLARALRANHREPERALALAKEALAHYASFPGFAPERTVIEAWMKQ